MSRTLRLAGAVALACGTVPLLGVSPVWADQLSAGASSQGYFNASGIITPDPVPQPIPNAPKEVDGVNPGSLPVAAKANGEDKVSALLFDVFDVDPLSTVSAATLTVPLSTAQGDVSSPNAAPAKVVACKAGDTGFGGEDGTGLALAPERLCGDFEAVATASADGTAYVFDVTALVQEWVAVANDGLVLTSLAEARAEPFQVVFQPGDKAVLAVTYTPPVETEVPVDAPVGVTPPIDFGSPGGFSETPGFSGGSGEVPSFEVAPAPQAGVAPTPVTPPTVATPAAAGTPVALESLRPTTSFWLGALLLTALLALLSLIMGDSRLPLVRGPQTRLARALAERQGVSGVGAAPKTSQISRRPAAI